jgi:hypothetical protein
MPRFRRTEHRAAESPLDRQERQAAGRVIRTWDSRMHAVGVIAREPPVTGWVRGSRGPLPCRPAADDGKAVPSSSTDAVTGGPHRLNPVPFVVRVGLVAALQTGADRRTCDRVRFGQLLGSMRRELFRARSPPQRPSRLLRRKSRRNRSPGRPKTASNASSVMARAA